MATSSVKLTGMASKCAPEGEQNTENRADKGLPNWAVEELQERDIRLCLQSNHAAQALAELLPRELAVGLENATNWDC